MTPRRRRSGRSRLPTRKTARRWRVPPPLLHGPESLEAGSVLEEGLGPLGAVLWQSLRDVMLWTATAPERRAELFATNAEADRAADLARIAVPDALVRPLEALGSLLADPTGVEAERIARACEAITEWAEGDGNLGTAVAYAQAVALVRDTDASTAFHVGVLARRRAEHARAETWFRRAVMLARQSGDWVAYCLAFSGLGNLYLQRGNLPTARKLHMRARRAARRRGLRAIEGRALHDLFVIATSSDAPAEAEAFANGALRAYGPLHPRLSALAHDVAYYWMEQGHFARALPVFEAVLPHMERPADRVRVLADIARAAAGAGESESFEAAWSAAVALLEEPEAAEGMAQALLDLAHGASTLGEWDRAEEAATRALRVAASRNQGKVRFEAEAVLDSARRRPRSAPAPVVAESGTEDGDALASRLVESLTASGRGPER